MTIEDFWNHAFLAALSRLSAADAMSEADRATDMCIERWQKEAYNWAPQYLTRWKDQDISKVPYSGQPEKPEAV